MHEILTIWMKELRDTIRDRRTLIVMVLVPVLLTPAMIVGVSKLAGSSAKSAVHIAVAGGSAAPGVVRLLRAQPHVDVVTSTNAVAAVKNGKADAGLIVAPDFSARVAAGNAGRVTVVSDSTQFSSARAVEAITAALAGYRTDVVAARLRSHGVDPGVLAPVVAATRDVATPQALAGFVLSLIVPLFLVIYSMASGMYTAMDLSAGEKERFTMEALLLSPATKLQITLGKLLAVSTVALCTIVLSLASLFVALQRAPLTSQGGASSATIAASLPAGTIVLLALLGALLAISFSALELALGVFARSFKEAQNYITPLYLVAVVPTAALSSIPGFKPGLPFFAIPAINAVLVFKEALIGAVSAAHVALTVATMLLFCLACIVVTLRIFSDERVLLRS